MNAIVASLVVVAGIHVLTPVLASAPKSATTQEHGQPASPDGQEGWYSEFLKAILPAYAALLQAGESLSIDKCVKVEKG